MLSPNKIGGGRVGGGGGEEMSACSRVTHVSLMV